MSQMKTLTVKAHVYSSDRNRIYGFGEGTSHSAQAPPGQWLDVRLSAFASHLGTKLECKYFDNACMLGPARPVRRTHIKVVCGERGCFPDVFS